MKITILGSASGLAVPDRSSSAILVETGGRFHLLDTGEGVARRLSDVEVDPEEIATVFISHTHPDHASGIFMLLQWMYLKKRKRPLSIYLPQGVLPGFQGIFPYFHIYREKWPFAFELLPIRPGIIFEDKAFRITGVANDHLAGNRGNGEKHGIGCDSYSFVCTDADNRKIIYTSDVTGLSHLASQSTGTHVLICECTHLGMEDILSFAVEKGIPRVILTHIPPELEGETPIENKNCKIDFAEDGTVIEV